MSSRVSYQRALLLVIGSSLLVPVAGLATAPILAHALGVAGRGEAGAALAPNLLIVGGATLGLPAALTYFLARRPHLTRVALGWASALAIVLGLIVLVGVYFATPFLSAGDSELAHLMLVGTVLALPGLLVALLRGAAAGRQMWRAVAVEKAINTTFRVGLLSGYAIAGQLDVASAVIILSLAPIVSGLAYLGLASRPPRERPRLESASRSVPSDLLAFGSKVWLGSLAIMLMARLSQLLVTPLSDVEQLGLLIVAITISDVPYIVTQTVREVIFGVNSETSDQRRLLATSRIASLLALIGSLAFGLTLPLWIDVVFGPGFSGAVVPTWLLLGAACAAVPGLIAGAGLESVGRPGLRSMALVSALAVNVASLLLLVPLLGAEGGALAALLSTLTSTIVILLVASRVLGVPGHHFFVTQAADLLLLRASIRAIVRRLGPAREREQEYEVTR